MVLRLEDDGHSPHCGWPANPKRLILTDPDGELGNMYVDISAASLARKFPNLKLADFAAWLLKNGARKNKQR